jgi:N-acetylglucosaminyl-diphospho-decaprenol L-rhamnosyltransferase
VTVHRPDAVIAVIVHFDDPIRTQQLCQDLDGMGLRSIVVDHAISEGQEIYRAIDTDLTGVTILRPRRNGGFAAGVNLGISEALERGAAFVLLVNPDMRLGHDCVSAMLNEMSERERLGAVTASIFDQLGNVWFQDGRVDRFGVPYQSETETRHGLRYITGALMLIRKAAYLTVDGFAEEYFLYWEDIDFSNRLMHAGWDIDVVTSVSAIHDRLRASGRSAEVSPHKIYFETRNRLLFFRRSLSGFGTVEIGIGTVKLALRVLRGSAGARREAMRYLYKGIVDGAKGQIGPGVFSALLAAD